MVGKRNLCYIPLKPHISAICQSLHYSANITGYQTNTQICSFLHYRRGFLRKIPRKYNKAAASTFKLVEVACLQTPDAAPRHAPDAQGGTPRQLRRKNLGGRKNFKARKKNFLGRNFNYRHSSVFRLGNSPDTPQKNRQNV